MLSEKDKYLTISQHTVFDMQILQVGYVAPNKHRYPAKLKDGSPILELKCGSVGFNVAELKLSNVQLLYLFCIDAQNSPQILHLLGLTLKFLPLLVR